MGRPGQRTSVRLVHFADYHAHAVPFYSQGEARTAGIARLIAHLRSVRPGAVVTNGGDMFNVGSPAWSDRYQGLEWPWLNGLVDVMAFGNHDSDYGPEVFARCRAGLDHPILCANLVDDTGHALVAADGRPYLVHDVEGVRLGLLSAAGPDVVDLVSAACTPVPGTWFVDRVVMVERLVARMRREDRVDAVVLIGHGLHEDDVALARAVPGIDLVLGTHSHRLQDLAGIPGTDTAIVAPYQYATHVADLHLDFRGGALIGIRGGLVRLGADRPEAPDVAAEVARLQADLEADPTYAHLLEVVGDAPDGVATDGQEERDSALGNLVADTLRDAAEADVALVGASAIREPIPPGPVRVGDVLTALPYENQVVAYQVDGRTLLALLDTSLAHRGTNAFAQVGGVRFGEDRGRVRDVLVHQARSAGRWRVLDPDRTYRVVVNDFLATGTAGYRELLAGLPERRTGLEVRAVLIDHVRGLGQVQGRPDGRMDRPVTTPAAVRS